MKTIQLFTLQIALLLLSFAAQAQWVQMGNTIKKENNEDSFGRSISLSADGKVLAIAGIKSMDTGGYIGYVQTYIWEDNAWKERGESLLSRELDDRFGHSISLSDNGNTLAVGAIYYRENGERMIGKVSIYSWFGSDWVKKGNDLIGKAEDDWFGAVVRLSSSGNTLAIGARGNNYAQVYTWNGSAWKQKGETLHNFESTLALAANGETIALGTSESTQVYFWDGTNWNQQGQDIKAFTKSLSLSADGNVLAIGDIVIEVSVYNWNNSDWVEKGKTIVDYELVILNGRPVSLSADGNMLVAGVSQDAGSGEHYEGPVQVYDWNNKKWKQIGEDILGENEKDGFGHIVELSSDGKILVVSALWEGEVKVFRYEE